MVGISSRFTLGVRVAASENVSVLRLLCEGEAYLAQGALSSMETNLPLFTEGKNVALSACLPGHTCRAGFDDETSTSQSLTQAVDWALATECQQQLDEGAEVSGPPCWLSPKPVCNLSQAGAVRSKLGVSLGLESPGTYFR